MLCSFFSWQQFFNLGYHLIHFFRRSPISFNSSFFVESWTWTFSDSSGLFMKIDVRLKSTWFISLIDGKRFVGYSSFRYGGYDCYLLFPSIFHLEPWLLNILYISMITGRSLYPNASNLIVETKCTIKTRQVKANWNNTNHICEYRPAGKC